MIQFFFIIFYFFFLSNILSQPPEGHDQNLVPNSDFESLMGRKPESDVDGSGIFRYNVVGWKSPTATTPDIKIALPSVIKKAKRDGIYLDKPHSGIKMAAILTHNPESERHDTYREYLQIKLKKPLKIGVEYYCEFWACRARLSKYISNNLGVALSPTLFSEKGYLPLTKVKPDYNFNKLINENGRKWERISFTFISTNRSEYICIGNFFDNDKTIMVEAKDAPKVTVDEKAFNNAYYLIDDVLLCATKAEEPPKVGTVIKLDRVFFETAKWDLLPASNEQLDELVNLMLEYSSMLIEIHGHTDSRGDDKYNQNLSENRTKSVFDYLVQKGIEANRMKYIGYGEKKPIADNNDSEGRQLNRRVEFVVTHIDEENTVIKQNNEIKPYTDNE